MNARTEYPVSMNDEMPYGVGVDVGGDAERMWQCATIEAAYLTAGVESFGTTAVVVRFTGPPNVEAEIVAIYRDGSPDA